MRAQSQLLWKAALAAGIGWSLLHALQGQAASLVVTTLANSGTGSLRAAIASANDGDVITFAISGTITSLSGELLIGKSLDIVGPGPTKLGVSGNNASRVFNIAGGASVSLTGLTICNGHAHDGAAATSSATPGSPGDDGGGIYNAGTLALTNCVITGCRSGQGGAGFTYANFIQSPGCSDGGPGGNGGGIYNAGTLTLVACTLSYSTNGSGGSGGDAMLGICPGGAGGSGGSGAGLYDFGAATFIACTFAFNSAGAGGAGGYGGSGDITQSDGAGGGWGGSGGSGGGIYSQSSPTFISCTITGNTGGRGGQGGKGGYGNTQSMPREGTVGNGGPGGNGAAGGGGGGLYCPGFFQSVACTSSGNSTGAGGVGGQGGRGGMSLLSAGGNGGNGGNGGSGGAGGGANTGGGGTLQNVLAAQNSAAAGGLAGAGGLRGSGSPSGSSGYPGSGGLGGSGPDLFGAFTSNGHNLIGLADGNSGFTDGVLGDIVGSGTPLNPLVGPLANNGGPTFTCALLAGSPALDTGDDTILDAPFGLTIDQRGLPRKSGSHVDIGALEVQWASNPICVAACISATDGAVQMTLTNIPGASLTILAATNPSLPVSTWTVLGPMFEVAPGQFQFIDPASTNLPQRIYRVRCP